MNNTKRKPLRGLQDIRTIAGKIDHLSYPHIAYMRISCLEMEKARKNSEKESALHRVAIIDERIREINEEKTNIQMGLAAKETAAKQQGGHQSGPAASEGDFFKIRY